MSLHFDSCKHVELETTISSKTLNHFIFELRKTQTSSAPVSQYDQIKVGLVACILWFWCCTFSNQKSLQNLVVPLKKVARRIGLCTRSTLTTWYILPITQIRFTYTLANAFTSTLAFFPATTTTSLSRIRATPKISSHIAVVFQYGFQHHFFPQWQTGYLCCKDHSKYFRKVKLRCLPWKPSMFEIVWVSWSWSWLIVVHSHFCFWTWF